MEKKLTRSERLRIVYDDFVGMQINIYAIYGKGKREQFIILNGEKNKRDKRIIGVITESEILTKISRSFDICGFSYDYQDIRSIFIKWKKTLPKLENVICKGEI